MTPEPGYYLNKLRDSLPEASEPVVSKIDSEATKAIKEGKRLEAIEALQRGQELADHLNQLDGLLVQALDLIDQHPDLKEINIGVHRFLKDRGLQPAPQLSSPPSPHEEESFYDSDEPSTAQTKISYADGFLRLVQKNQDGEFAYSSLNSIIRGLLSEDQQDDMQARLEYRKLFTAYRRDFILRMASLGFSTISELAQKRLKNQAAVRNKKWKDFYEFVAREYGDYTPEKFATEILLRFSSPKTLEKTSELFVKESETEQGFYIPNARAVAMTALIERGPDGIFRYGIGDIAKLVIQDERLRDDRRAIKKSEMNVLNARWSLKNLILSHSSDTMQGTIVKILSGGGRREWIRNPQWQEFYTKVLSDYSHLSSQEEFIRAILYRNEEIVPEDPEGQVYDAIKGTSLREIDPAHEIVLYGALTRSGVIQAIEELLEKPIEEALKEGGWNKKGDWYKYLEASVDIAARRRQKDTGIREIDSKEARQAVLLIIDLIKNFKVKRKEYREIERLPGVNGLRFLYCIVSSLDPFKTEELINILFPRRKYKVGRDGFVQ